MAVPPIDYTVLERDTLLASRGWHPETLSTLQDFDAIMEKRYIVPTETDIPQVVLMGSSIAGSYAQIMEQLASAYDKPMSFHVAMGVGGIMDIPEALAESSAQQAERQLKGQSNNSVTRFQLRIGSTSNLSLR